MCGIEISSANWAQQLKSKKYLNKDPNRNFQLRRRGRP